MHFLSDLIPTNDLKKELLKIKNYLYGNAAYTSREDIFTEMIISILICKLYDEVSNDGSQPLLFYKSVSDSINSLYERINHIYESAKNSFSNILFSEGSLSVDKELLPYIVETLQHYSLTLSSYDAISDAFELFMSHHLKGSKGQFFTPMNIIKSAIKLLDPNIDDKILDPACGSGRFIIECSKYLKSKRSMSDDRQFNIYGIDKDSFLCKVAQSSHYLLGSTNPSIFCEDSLDPPECWSAEARQRIKLESFDIIFTNPPFGVKIPIKGAVKLAQYELGHKWTNLSPGKWIKNQVKGSEAPQILFIERCLNLLKTGGKLAIILPDGILSNPTDGYIRQYILENTKLLNIIDLPLNTFLPYTAMKTNLLILQKLTPPKDYTFFMSYPKNCGHDKRGKATQADDIELIPQCINESSTLESKRLGFSININDMKEDILLPKYYNPELNSLMDRFLNNNRYQISTIGSLVKNKAIKIIRGHEVGSKYYDTGPIPFIRTSEICNWEIAADPTHCVSEEIYEAYRHKQNVKSEDILIINDGTYLIGRAAMVTDLDVKMVFQSHFRKITALKNISPYLILALLGLEAVQQQIESKAFRQGTISTLGNRLLEVKLPIPVDAKERQYIEDIIRDVILSKRDAKLKAQAFKLFDKTEALMGLPNKKRYGNL